MGTSTSLRAGSTSTRAAAARSAIASTMAHGSSYVGVRSPHGEGIMWIQTGSVGEEGLGNPLAKSATAQDMSMAAARPAPGVIQFGASPAEPGPGMWTDTAWNARPWRAVSSDRVHTARRRLPVLSLEGLPGGPGQITNTWYTVVPPRIRWYGPSPAPRSLSGQQIGERPDSSG